MKIVLHEICDRNCDIENLIEIENLPCCFFLRLMFILQNIDTDSGRNFSNCNYYFYYIYTRRETAHENVTDLIKLKIIEKGKKKYI
jgi:hypothetical protein